MASNQDMASIATGALGILLISGCTVPALLGIIRRFLHVKETPPIHLPGAHAFDRPGYEDKDGEASDEALKGFSDLWQRLGIIILSITGLGISLTQVVISITKGQHLMIVPFGLQMGSWVSPTAAYLFRLSF